MRETLLRLRNKVAALLLICSLAIFLLFVPFFYLRLSESTVEFFTLDKGEFQISERFETAGFDSVSKGGGFGSRRSMAELEKRNRTAICLAGELGMFQFTVPTLQAYLLSAYEKADVFITTPLDADSYKLWTMAEDNVVAVHLVKRIPFPEDKIIQETIGYSTSELGRQGLLQYSGLVQRCSHLIRLYERKHGFQYEWILRTRPDGLWRQPPPPLQTLSKDKIYIPIGSDWGTGLNDRFCLASRIHSLKAMNWIVTIPDEYRKNKRHLIAEEKHLELFRSTNLIDKVVRKSVHFCVWSVKTFPFPLKWNYERYSAAFSPIDAPGDGGGRYCRPCKPVEGLPIEPEAAYRIFHTSQFCNSSDPTFLDNWRENYDRLLGTEIATKRNFFEENDNFWLCVKYLEKFILSVDLWKGVKDVYKICNMRFNP